MTRSHNEQDGLVDYSTNSISVVSILYSQCLARCAICVINMNNIIPGTVRREILCLDMHDISVKEIVRQTGVKRSTVSAIINRTRSWKKEQWRGNVVLFYDPTGIFKSGARFNLPDLESMVKLSNLADGTVFEIPHRDGSVYRARIQEGQLELWQK